VADQTAADFFGATTIRPPLDPELAPVEEAMRAVFPTVSDETLPETRRLLADGSAGMEPEDLTAGGRVRVEERQVPGPEGAPDITLLILSPVEDRGPKGAIFHIHGGGMVSGTRRTGVSFFLPYVIDGSAVVVSVEYRLAPEHPDPAPVEDCYAGLAWTAKNAAELGIDPERLLIVGSSAGGGLAAGTALLARDRAFPQLSHQVLICPMLDDRFETHSSRMVDRGYGWDRHSNLYGWTSLLGERRGGPDVSQYAAPARAEDPVRIACDPDAPESDRGDAVKRLGLTGPVTVVIASPQPPPPYSTRVGRHAVTLAAGTAVPPSVLRAGTAIAQEPAHLPDALKRAHLALRLTDRVDGPGPSLVAYDDLGALSVLADRTTPQEAAGIADVRRLDQTLSTHPWVIYILQAVLDHASMRQAATCLHLHHSTLQERLVWLATQLGYAVTKPGGRQRATVAVAFWRIAHSDELAADGG
jgi:acetyl esterase/lipase